jgi:serine/threonine protein kinase
VLIASSNKNALPSYEFSLSVVAQAAAGLDHAHRRCDLDGKPLRLVHRDVSLTNIMVGHDGIVKVVDFGIARSTLSSVHTSPGVVRGKASYMSPEQCVGDRVDHRTDVFALGIVLYELTTGTRCFAGKSDFERMLAVVQGDYIAPSDLVAEYPPELEQVVRTALAANPEHRYPSCAAMIDALERVMKGRGWLGGSAAIHRTMHELFGDVKTPWVATEEAPRTIENVILPISALPTAKITRPRRFARGTVSDMLDPRHWADDDDDALTRGRHAIRRRSSVPFLAA